jgi:hypothetical protein
MSHVIGGWRLSAVGSWASGRPLVIGGVTASNGVSTGLGAHANLNGDPTVDDKTLDRWFNTAVFAQPTPFTFGTGTRTYPQVRGPKVNRVDLLLSRLHRVRTSTIELRIEAQNAFNSPQFGEPIGGLTDANFGRIITGGGERRLQLGVRVGF